MAHVEVAFCEDTKSWTGAVDSQIEVEGLKRDEAYQVMRARAIELGASFTMYNRKGNVTLQFGRFRGHNTRTLVKQAVTPAYPLEVATAAEALCREMNNSLAPHYYILPF